MAGMATGPGDLSGDRGPAGGLLNLCAQRNLVLWRMVQQDRFTLVVQNHRPSGPAAGGTGPGGGVSNRGDRAAGAAFFSLAVSGSGMPCWRGWCCAWCCLGVGSRTILTVDVTGNQALSAEEIIAQLRLCGVSVGTYAPSIPVREVENRMMLAMDQLTFFSLNLHGTRAEVIVREREEGPDLRPEERLRRGGGSGWDYHPHRALGGDAQVHEGGRGVPGDVLISGVMDLDPIPRPQRAWGPASSTQRERCWPGPGAPSPPRSP